MSPEDGEKDHDSQNKYHGPFGPAEEPFIAPFVRRNVHRAVNIMRIVVRHVPENPSKNRGTIAKRVRGASAGWG
jgi:hypothetical protein